MDTSLLVDFGLKNSNKKEWVDQKGFKHGGG